MPPLSSLRIAALFFFITGGLAAALPASADTANANESSYANALRTINPKLPDARARAYARSIMADAWRTHLDPRFIMSIVTVESRWKANAVSRVGARGLGQLMPGTASMYGVANPFDPNANVDGGTRYLHDLLKRYKGNVRLAVAAYNAGPGAVDAAHGIPKFAETRAYVDRVVAGIR